MKRKKILPLIALAILIVSGLSVAFIMGCSTSSDDGGSSTSATLNGTVKDADTGAIISGATIKIDDTETTTDNNGTYSLSGLSTGTYTLTVSATGYNSYQTSITLVDGSNTKNVTLTAGTTQTGTLTGTVKYGDTLVEGVLVQLQGAGSFTTAADGVYSFASVPYGTYTLTATKTSYSDYTANVIISAATNTFNISLTTSQDIPTPDEGKGNVVGYVTDDSGSPLANVECTLYNHNYKNSGKYVVVYTDANGRYVFVNVDPGNYQLVFALSGYDIPYIILDVDPGSITEPPTNPADPPIPNPIPDPPVTILQGTITRQAPLSLEKVVDPTPTPSPSPSITPSPSPSPSAVPLEDVTVILGDEGKPAGFAVQTDANGFYRFSSPPTGSIRITGIKAGYQNYTTIITINSQTTNTYDFTMESAP